MEGVPLLSGAYQARSIVASAQRCVNLYLENNPQNIRSPTPTTHYQRPGKTKRWACPEPGVGRGLYCASNGDLYAVAGQNVYFINRAYGYNYIGQIDVGNNPVSMADNGISGGAEIALVDGTTNGYKIDMTDYSFSPIVDPDGLFTGADIVAYLQTYFIFNTIPNTQNFIISQPNSLTFDALDIAAKVSYSDNLIAIGIRSKELWLFGDKSSTEPWILSGAVDFPFEGMPSTFLPYGCASKYSVTFADTSLFWVSINEQGQAIIVRSEGYVPKRISTYAIEQEIQKYATISDAVGSSFQMGGHTFVAFTFPTADKTWVYDLATDQWSQFAWTDGNGSLHRDRALFYASAYNKNFAQDWETGDVYELSMDVYDDDGDPVSYIRGFPVIEKELNRISHWALRAYMESGTDPDVNVDDPVTVLLYISDDNGKSFYDPVEMSLGRQGQYDTVAQATRLGMARARVYELIWSANAKTALNGVYIDPEEAES